MSAPISVFGKGWRLASKGHAHERASYQRKQKWKVFFHTLKNPFFASRWFALLQSDEMKEVAEHRPILYIKPFRPYISVKWNKQQKIKVIRDTYRFLRSKEKSLWPALTNKDGKVLAEISFDAEHQGQLILGYNERFRKEGELVLTLECEKLGGKIVSVAFSLEETEKGKWNCLLGCVQGYNTVNQQEGAFKLMQKLMHGLRPNAFIICCVQDLARHLGCEKVLATGNSIQAFRKKHAIHLPWLHTINFDYDNFWTEMEGKNIGEGWFELPLIPHRKAPEDIKTHKRALYRRRYELLDDISGKIAGSVS
jgi:uncharacterized protein VirK/YbjX